MPDPAPATPRPRSLWKPALWLAAVTAILTLQVWFPRVDAPQLNDTYNVDLGGRNALFQFTQRRAANVSRNLRPLSRLATDLTPDATICILGPARNPTESEWRILLAWVARGGRLLYAARWDAPAVAFPNAGLSVVATGESTPSLFGSAGAGRVPPPGPPNPSSDASPPGLIPPPAADTPGGAVAGTGPSEPSTPAVAGPALGKPKLSLLGVNWQSVGRIECLGGELLLSSGNTRQAVRLPYGEGLIVLTASDHLFSNRSLYDKATRNGPLAAQLLAEAGVGKDSRVVFDESLNMTGTPRVVGLVLDPLLRPITIQSALLLLLVAWGGSTRFGSPLPPTLPDRHNVTDHTNALGNLYWRSGNGVVPLKGYLEQLLGELKLGLRGGKTLRSVESVSARAGMSVDETRRLLAVATEASDRNSVLVHDAAALIRKLSRLRDRRETL